MKLLTAEDVKNIHSALEKQFPLMEKGILNEGLVQAAVEKQNRVLYGSTLYPDIFTKAASLMESLTRWHGFVDGNKRIGLMSAFILLYENGIYLAIPINAVQFTVKVADTKETDDVAINNLVNEIAIWLNEHSSNNKNAFAAKVWKYNFWPLIKLIFLYAFGFRKRVQKTLAIWFSIEGHPEYAVEAGQVLAYLFNLMRLALK